MKYYNMEQRGTGGMLEWPIITPVESPSGQWVTGHDHKKFARAIFAEASGVGPNCSEEFCRIAIASIREMAAKQLSSED